jgi:hypothetical protein
MESHLDKIKKLLRLSKSSNPHEAELAMQRAMELAAKHAVDVENLRNDPEFSDIIHKWFPMKARLSREWKLALNIAVNYFNVSACIDRGRKEVVLVGQSDAIEVADYIVGFLVRACRWQAKNYSTKELQARRRMTSGKRAAFIAGFFTGISVQLREGRFDLMRHNTELAIVLATDEKRRDEELARIVGKMTSIKTKPLRRSAATIAGFCAGRDTKLNRPLAGNGQGVLALEG